MLTKKLSTKINTLRSEFHELSVGKDELLKLISETEVFEQVYNSNAIENSTLTIEEIEKILLQIDLDRYISERELFEAKNLARVVEYIDARAKDKELDNDMILFLHKMLISNISDDIAGRFRIENEFVRVGNHIAPAPAEIHDEMKKIFTEYKSGVTKNIVERIAQFHLAFERLHPFVDGNGRIGRSLNNYLFIREGDVPINIRFIDRANYYEAFKAYDRNGSTKIMEDIILKALINSYHKRITYLKGLKVVTLSEYAKENKLSHPNLINKAKRQTIPAFREKGVWKIGVAYTCIT
jgi:Fic family protein